MNDTLSVQSGTIIHKKQRNHKLQLLFLVMDDGVTVACEGRRLRSGGVFIGPEAVRKALFAAEAGRKLATSELGENDLTP